MSSWFYSETKLEPGAFKDLFYISKPSQRPYETFNLADTVDRALLENGILLTVNKDKKLHLYNGEGHYSAHLPRKLPLRVEELRKSPLRDIIICAGADELVIGAPVSLAVSVLTANDDTGGSARITCLRSANTSSGYLYEIHASPAADSITTALKAEGFLEAKYIDYIKLILGRNTMKKKQSDNFAKALIAQLDVIESAFKGFMESKSPEAMEVFNNDIFNFYTLYCGRADYNEEAHNEALTALAMSVSEIAAEISVFNRFIDHLSTLSDDEIYIKTLSCAAKEDRERTFNAFMELCGEFEEARPVGVLREIIKKNKSEPRKKYENYCKSKSKKLVKMFDKYLKKLAKKHNIKRFNNFYDALAALYTHMELLNFYADTPDYDTVKSEFGKLLKNMDNYALRLNMKVLAKEYKNELELDKEELKSLILPKAGKDELEKILKVALRLRKAL